MTYEEAQKVYTGEKLKSLHNAVGHVKKIYEERGGDHWQLNTGEFIVYCRNGVIEVK